MSPAPSSRRSNAAALVVCLLAASLAACDSGGPPTEGEVAGDYVAARFVLSGVRPSGGVDLLAAGGSFSASLTADGRFTSRLVVPADAELTEDGEGIDASFDGTFAVRSGAILFFHSEDYFLRDLDWRYEEGEIESSREALTTGVGYDVLLRR